MFITSYAKGNSTSLTQDTGCILNKHFFVAFFANLLTIERKIRHFGKVYSVNRPHVNSESLDFHSRSTDELLWRSCLIFLYK